MPDTALHRQQLHSRILTCNKLNHRLVNCRSLCLRKWPTSLTRVNRQQKHHPRRHLQIWCQHPTSTTRADRLWLARRKDRETSGQLSRLRKKLQTAATSNSSSLLPPISSNQSSIKRKRCSRLKTCKQATKLTKMASERSSNVLKLTKQDRHPTCQLTIDQNLPIDSLRPKLDKLSGSRIIATMAHWVADNSKLMLQHPKSKHYSKTQPTLKLKPRMRSLFNSKTCNRRRRVAPSLPSNNPSHHGNESQRMSSISQFHTHKPMIRSGKEHLSTSISFRTRLLE